MLDIRFPHELAAIAGRHSELLAAESDLWAKLSEFLVNIERFDAPLPHRTAPEVERLDDSTDRILSVVQAAEFLNLAPQTLARWRLDGGGPEFIRLGRRIFYRKTTLLEFIARRTYRNTSGYP